MKLQAIGLASMLFLSTAEAGFVSATWPLPGQETQESFLTLYAVGSDFGPVTFKPLAFPSTTQFGVGDPLVNGSTATRIDATMNFDSSELKIDFTRLDRGVGRNTTTANGAWIFAVTDSVQTLASGFLRTTANSGVRIDNGLTASLYDYTADKYLFRSSQLDSAFDGSYDLGGLVGSMGASFSGDLENWLISGHVYRFSYSIASANDSFAGATSSIGQFALMTVPEPGTVALLSVGLAGLGWFRRNK